MLEDVHASFQRAIGLALALKTSGCTKYATHLHVLHDADPSNVIDISVSCDGTWSRHGHTATHSVVVINWETGQVLDYEILTKRCFR